MRITKYFVLVFLALAVSVNAAEQKACPVREGDPIKKDIYVDYKGKRVYFCCASCKQKFLNTPENYLAKLPQFTDASEHSHDEHSHNHFSFNFGRLIVPAGILTFVSLLATLSTGLFMKKNRKLLFPWHKRLAILTVISALLRIALVIGFH